MVVKAAEDRLRCNGADVLNRAMPIRPGNSISARIVNALGDVGIFLCNPVCAAFSILRSIETTIFQTYYI
jgi:hypothetical protein